MGAPVEYYRVQDNSSATRFNKRNGFKAGDTQLQLRMFSPRDRAEERNLSNALGRHLDWSDRTPSPFISVYSNLNTAIDSAIARVKDGKRDVVIAHINVEQTESRLWYRKVRDVAKEIGLWIQPQAWENSHNEFIFLRHIPAEAVTIISISK